MATGQKISRQQLSSAMHRAGQDAPPELIASHLMAPTLAPELGGICSTGFLSALAEKIAQIEQSETTLPTLAIDPITMRDADRIFRFSSPIGGVVGLAIGSIAWRLLIEPRGFLLGIFFPGVILCAAFSFWFQGLVLSLSQRVRRALLMAYGVHQAAKRKASHWKSLEWRDFEREVAILFRQIGFRVKLTAGSGDKGVDIVASRDSKRYLVQCKQYSKAVGPNFVRELIGTLVREKGDVAILIAASGFTNGAFEAALGTPILLLNLDDILEIQEVRSLDMYLTAIPIKTQSHTFLVK